MFNSQGNDLIRRIFQNQQKDSPPLGNSNGAMSPISSLAYDLNSSVVMHTPCKRLSLSSTSSLESPNSSTSMVKSFSFDSGCNSSGDTENTPTLSPKFLSLSCKDKENIPTPYYSPSHSSYNRVHQSPLKEVQNKININRNLTFSPVNKHKTPRKFSLYKSPVNDLDNSSQDSGYSGSIMKKSGISLENFNAPIKCAPRKLNLDSSPEKNSPLKLPNERQKRSFASLCTFNEDTMFDLDLIESLSAEDSENNTPSCFTNLLSGPLSSKREESKPVENDSDFLSHGKPVLRRFFSVAETSNSRLERKLDCPAEKPNSSVLSLSSFKRPHPPSEIVESKRRRQDDRSNSIVNVIQDSHSPSENLDLPVRHKILRSHSESHISIMKALNKSENHDGPLLGDFSRGMSLPLVQYGKHSDLPAINIDTMADLMRGSYKDKVNYMIIDCRYPYEFDGGHIKDAVNWHHPKMVVENLYKKVGEPKVAADDTPRNVLIFHCEFSAERGPKAQRLMRNEDRMANKDHYPKLYFPELYLLEGGYKSFYAKYPELCTPNGYIEMANSEFGVEMKLYRAKSKTLSGDLRKLKDQRTAETAKISSKCENRETK